MASTDSFSKEKYLQIVQSLGVSAAVTALHRDIEQLEHETFEGAQGYRPDLFEKLKEIRKFSRELWNMHLENPALKA